MDQGRERSANVRFGSQADILRCQCDVRFTPESGHVRCNSICPLSANSGHRDKACLSAIRHSLDHLIGAADERVRDIDTERLGGPKIDDQLNFGQLLDRYVTWFVALENASGGDTKQPV